MTARNLRWRNRPKGSNWGEFGADDQLGRLNFLTPEVVRKGLAEAREGLAFCLSLPLDYPGGNVLSAARKPPVLRPTLRRGKPYFAYRMAEEDARTTDVVNDDVAILHLQYSTHWDALGHVGSLFDADGDGEAEAVFYNGYRAETDFIGPTDAADAGAGEERTTFCAKALGAERMAERALQGRGVLVDLAHHYGRERAIIGYDALMKVMDTDKVAVEKGDILCLHTGLGAAILEMNKEPTVEGLRSCAVLDGRDDRLLQWITDSNIAAIAADNYAVELNPGRDQCDCCAYLPLHEHCIFKLGMPLGELWYLTELAAWLRANGRSRFLLTAPPLRLPGSVGTPLTPVATV
ncbi:MAG TPA: cyclase family protein [Mesorhizobium sp.]